MIYLDFIKVLDMVPRDVPTREVGKKAQAAPGVEMSSAELTQGAAASISHH